ncbi:hypothetical protein MLD38_009125 [Melastoma candidum]|uniref:Uncharacterized protein n=1 Tax=Melastoma candidum TaxID=119954 RepID=A0ACB9RVZ8_9MYRT|nr:hypothetical protein MLD38_009125 [Melastoma candidum]
MDQSSEIRRFLFLCFLFMGFVIPLFDTHSCIPRSYDPYVLTDLNASYSRYSGVFLALAFLWPLSLANLVGVLGSKPCLRTTCLVYKVCCDFFAGHTARVDLVPEKLQRD